MSALDRFIGIRRLRALAADNYALAAESFSDSVRARYLAIADHYTALADAELLSDKRERKSRLAEMQAKRAAARAQKVSEPAPAVPQPRKLRLIKGDGAAAAQRDARRIAAVGKTRDHASASVASDRQYARSRRPALL
jgi:hypothetical protein